MDEPFDTLEKVQLADPKSLLPTLEVIMTLTRPPLTKKERKQWCKALKSFRITIEAGGLGPIYDVTAYDLYLWSLLRGSPTDSKQSPPPAL